MYDFWKLWCNFSPDVSKKVFLRECFVKFLAKFTQICKEKLKHVLKGETICFWNSEVCLTFKLEYIDCLFGVSQLASFYDIDKIQYSSYNII